MARKEKKKPKEKEEKPKEEKEEKPGKPEGKPEKEEEKPPEKKPKKKEKRKKRREKGAKSKLYKLEGEKVKRLRPYCPRCGPGVFMADHGDRFACGRCGYTDFKK